MKKVLLYSGGTDSWLMDKIWRPDLKLYINIHGFYSEDEINKLPKDVKIIDFPFLGTTEELDTNFVPLRNLYFLMIASNFGDEICYGATFSDRGSKDKRQEFIEKTQDIIDYCLIGNSFTQDRHIKINQDFINLNKYELIQLYLNKGGTIKEYIEDSFSCYHSINGKECYHCKQCYKKFLNGIYFDYPYSKEIKDKMLNYLKMNVIPKDNYEGTYFAERSGESEYAVKAVDKLFKEYNLDWRDYQ